jgi:hypothetical protein
MGTDPKASIDAPHRHRSNRRAQALTWTDDCITCQSGVAPRTEERSGMMSTLGRYAHLDVERESGPSVDGSPRYLESYLYREQQGLRGAGRDAQLRGCMRSDLRISGSYLSQRKRCMVGSQPRPSVTRGERLNETYNKKRSGQSIWNPSLQPSFCMISFYLQPLADGIMLMGGLSRLKSVICMTGELFYYPVTGIRSGPKEMAETHGKLVQPEDSHVALRGSRGCVTNR